MSDFHTLSIKNINQETADAVSISFDVPSFLQDDFTFKAGQYLTLKTNINGAEVRRAYSICSSPNSGELQVSVKAVENGAFSTFATSQLSEGFQLDVHTPEGFFTLEPKDNLNYIGFAAGSGITPILSMIKTTLEDSTNASFTLVYGNKSEADIIFKSELERLQAQYPNRFNLHYVLSRQNVEGTLFGRIDEGFTNYYINNIYKDTTFTSAFLCGPEEMIQTVSKTLQSAGFGEDQISFELFTSSTEDENTELIKEGETEVTVLLDDEELSFTMKQTNDILSEALRNDVDAPYSCQGGVCSSCLAKVTEGKAVMTKNSILTDDEVEDGFILTCQAHPTPQKITIDFDDV